MALRPTVELGEYTASSQIVDADDYRVTIGLADRPDMTLAEYATAIEALDLMFRFKQRFPVRLWYNGLEFQVPFESYLDLARKLIEVDDCWEAVEEAVAANAMPTSVDDTDVVEAVTARAVAAAAEALRV